MAASPEEASAIRVRRLASATLDPDRQLVERTLAGDLAAFEMLIERHRDVVFRIAARIVGRDEAEDVAQDTFLRAFHRLDRFRGESPFRSWLLQIAQDAALTALTRRRPEPVDSAARLAEEAAPSEHRANEPAAGLESRERRERLEVKLRELRPEHRVVLVLRDVEGLSYHEIAHVMEAPLGSVKGWLSRARRELIEVLRHNTYDWELPT